MHRNHDTVLDALPLSGWTVINLRASAAQASIRTTLKRYGARSLALPGFRLQVNTDADVIAHLGKALATGTGLFVSPMAVRAVERLLPGVLAAQPSALAVGAATAMALRAVGVAHVAVGQPETSEGLLALPRLQHGNDQTLVLIGAPNGRGVLGPTLRDRGFAMTECEVYARLPVRLDRRHWRALEAATSPLAVMLSSEQALSAVWAQAAEPYRRRLQTCVALASSPRLAAYARSLGFDRVLQAAGTRPEQHMQCLHTWVQQNVLISNGAP